MSRSVETIVKTNAGKIEGYQRGGLCVFKGIPYAASPVGERRRLPPEPVEPWSGVRQTQSYVTIAPQNPDETLIIEPMPPEPLCVKWCLSDALTYVEREVDIPTYGFWPIPILRQWRERRSE